MGRHAVEREPALEFTVDLLVGAAPANADYPVSLELHKIYRALPDEQALAAGDLRIVDESGEDYLYPATAFVAVSLPERARSSLRRTAVS